jgi:hypothetical protein
MLHVPLSVLVALPYSKKQNYTAMEDNGENSRGSSRCRVLSLMLGLGFLGAGGYLIWHFLGRTDTHEVAWINPGDYDWNNPEDYDDFSDVLGYVKDGLVRCRDSAMYSVYARKYSGSRLSCPQEPYR